MAAASAFHDHGHFQLATKLGDPASRNMITNAQIRPVPIETQELTLFSQLTTLENFSQSLEALKLFPQETLTLEEK